MFKISSLIRAAERALKKSHKKHKRIEKEAVITKENISPFPEDKIE